MHELAIYDYVIVCMQCEGFIVRVYLRCMLVASNRLVRLR